VGCLLLPFWVLFAVTGVWSVVTGLLNIFYSSDLSGIGGPVGKIFAGAVLIAVPLFVLVTVRRKAWLNRNGRRVQADFVRVVGREVDSGEDGCYTAYRVICKWVNPETNQKYLFKSGYCYADPTDWLSGKTVEVVFDPSNPKRYRVDLSSLPPKAG
jgi:hypothetical protein